MIAVASEMVPEGWRVAPLGEVCRTTSGGTPSRRNDAHFKGDIPWVKSGELPDGIVHDIEESITQGAIDNSSAKLFPVGTLLIALYGATVGKLGVLPHAAATNQAVCAIFPDDDLDQKYLFWFLRYARSDLLNQAIGGAQTNISQEILRNLQVPIAPLAQQIRIVAEIEKQLSRLDEAVASLKRVKANLKCYQAAVLKAAVEGKLTEEWRKQNPGAGVSIDLFEPKNASSQKKKRAGRLWGSGSVPELTKEERAAVPPSWGWIKVGQLGLTVEDAVQVGPMSMKSKDFRETGLPVLNVGCVQWGFIDESKANFMPLGKVGSFKRYQIRKDDILFTRSGTVGRSAIAREEHDGWLMTFHLLRVRLDQRKCLPEYLRAVFEGAEHIKRQTRHGSIGSTRAGFNTKLLASLDVPLPSLDEQRTILAESSTMLSNIEVLDVSVSSQLKRAVALRQSILSRAFSGELELTAVGMNAEVLST